MSTFRRNYSRINTAIYKLRCALNKLHFKLIGNSAIAASAIIEPRARLQITNRDRNFVGLVIDSGSIIKNDVYLFPREGKITIGRKCSINPFCVLLGYGGIDIGNNVRIAARTSIIAFNHQFSDPSVPIIKQGNVFSGIRIEDDVWIGSGVRVLDGVTIGKGAVIGAGSVVTKNVAPFSVVAGVPARPIKSRESGLSEKQTGQ